MLEFQCHAPGALVTISPPLPPDSGGWKGSCLSGAVWSPDPEGGDIASWLMGDPGLCNATPVSRGFSYPPFLAPQVRGRTAA